MFALSACGAPTNATEAEVVTVVETVIVEVTAAPAEVADGEGTGGGGEGVIEEAKCPPGWPSNWPERDCPGPEWNVLYLQAETSLDILELTGVDANGVPEFEVLTADAYSYYDIVVVFDDVNTVSYPEFEFADGTNAEGSQVIVDEDGDPILDEDGELQYEKAFPGRWLEADEEYLYEIAGEYGRGWFVLAEFTFEPNCEDLDLTIPQSCNQGNSDLPAEQLEPEEED